jgi:hypothetical protein
MSMPDYDCGGFSPFRYSKGVVLWWGRGGSVEVVRVERDWWGLVCRVGGLGQPVGRGVWVSPY